jgi:hypothetical protein
VIEWAPNDSADVFRIATAAVFRVTVPIDVPLSRKSTVPVGVPLTALVTVAVRVTWVPNPAGLALEVSAMLVLSAAQLVSRLPTSMDPRPVAWSYPTPTRNPLKPPVWVVVPGVLLLHLLGTVTTQLEIPLDATVTS